MVNFLSDIIHEAGLVAHMRALIDIQVQRLTSNLLENTLMSWLLSATALKLQNQLKEVLNGWDQK